MKKNVMMRVASALLVAVLMTTCAISGTFAKYTTNATGSDSARVAKFGVVIDANGEMFTTSEGSVDAESVLSAGAVNDIENVVAPGMSGEMVSMTIAGTPEVAVEVVYDATVTISGWAIDGDDFYCPIVVTVDGTDIDGNTFDSATAFATAIEEEIEKNTSKYKAGTDLSGATAPVVTWEWAFSTGDANDLKDTALAATSSTIALSIKTTVNQLNNF